MAHNPYALEVNRHNNPANRRGCWFIDLYGDGSGAPNALQG